MEAHGVARDTSNTMSGVLLAFVRREYGEDVMRRIVEESGDDRPLEEIEDSTQWSSYGQTLALFRAALQVTGNPDVYRRAGEELLRHYSASEVIALLRSMGGPGQVLRLITDVANKQSSVMVYRCDRIEERSACLVGRLRADLPLERCWCEYAAGVFSSIPEVFGMPAATVEETACQALGAPECVFELSWDPDGARDTEAELRYLQEQVSGLTRRFEALEQLATELASVDEIDEVLTTITARASVAVRAPRYLLVVRLPRDLDFRVHPIGIADEAEARRLADEVLADPPDDHGGARLIVDVASAGQWYGRLAALQPDGLGFVPEERRLLLAYAGHAAAALETAAALEETRQQVLTLGALLDLSTALADARSTAEAADRLAHSMPKVLGCEQAAALVWDPATGELSCQGHSDRLLDPEAASRLPLSPETAQRLIGSLRPLHFGRGPSRGDEALEGLVAATGLTGGLAMPVVARGELFGVLAVHGGTGAGTAAQRLPGVASLAATAFANTRMLDQIRHQATHDALTGLPNLRMLLHLAGPPADGSAPPPGLAAGAAAERGQLTGLLFVDLDHFKEVNDRYGHAVGDSLLVEVGHRLQQGLRTRDTVVRIGGDEFAVLLPELEDEDEAGRVADRLLAALMEPYRLGDRRLHVSASIGVAVSEDGWSDLDGLLAQSDRAMYRAKAAGRGTIRRH